MYFELGESLAHSLNFLLEPCQATAKVYISHATAKVYVNFAGRRVNEMQA